MNLDKLMGFTFNIFFVIMLLLIIFYSLRIMSKDVGTKDKGKNKSKNNEAEEKPVAKAKKSEVKKPRVDKQKVDKLVQQVQTEEKKSYALEVQTSFAGSKFKEGTVVPMRNIITLGRKEGNSIVLTDKFVSSNHARIYVKDSIIILEDLNSTNGTFVNDQRVTGKIRLGVNDSIRLGSTVFKIIG